VVNPGALFPGENSPPIKIFFGKAVKTPRAPPPGGGVFLSHPPGVGNLSP